MYRVIDTRENHEEWLKERGGGIGSSEAAAVMGLNKWETPYMLWRRKRGLDAPKEENFAMFMGHLLEPVVAKVWEKTTGLVIDRQSEGDWLAVDTECPWLRVSPDRLYRTEDGGIGVVECKTTSIAVDAEEPPAAWFVQLQYQMGVLGAKEGYLAWLVNGREFGTQRYGFVPQFYAEIKAAVTDFWQRCVLGGDAPEDSTAADTMTRYPRHAPDTRVEMPATLVSVLGNLRAVREQIKVYKQQEEELADTLKMHIGDKEALTMGGKVVATWKAPKPSKVFDKEAFQAEFPEMYEKFTVVRQGARRLTLK